MILSFKGHDYKYAVEQIMLTMFPSERPEYTDVLRDGESSAAVNLSRGAVWTTASTKLVTDGRISRASARAKTEELRGELAFDRLCQKIIKLSFYRAAVKITGEKPEWGALTGIRPGKIASNMIERGMSPGKTARALERIYYVSPERSALCVKAAESGLRIKRSLGERDICLYAGIPFCPTRCAYCSFVSSSVEKSFKLIDPFLKALFLEIRAAAEIAKELGLRVISVYIGGGTPTTLSACQLTELILGIRSSFCIEDGCEFTVEAGRPDTITPEKLSAMAESGVNRISINPQTMQMSVLETIGRKHTPEDTVKAFEAARGAGFKNINMDMIAGLPGDTLRGFERSINEVLKMCPENITVHTLSRKRGARITEENTLIPSGEKVGQMLDYANTGLEKKGYLPYYLYRQKFTSGGFENVGWCRKSKENIYNVCIMEELCTVLALGGGGSTKMVEAKSGRIERIFNPYIKNIDGVIENKKRIKLFNREDNR